MIQEIYSFDEYEGFKLDTEKFYYNRCLVNGVVKELVSDPNDDDKLLNRELK